MESSLTRARILQAIADTKDDGLRVVLLMLLAVVDDIGSKIDTILNDEKSLRDAVLNGHSLVHDDHHTWVSRKMAEEATSTNSKRKIRDDVLGKILVGLLSALVTLAISGWPHQ